MAVLVSYFRSPWGYRSVMILIALACSSLCIGCYRDVTYEPGSKFSRLAGRELVVTRPLLVAGGANVADYYVFCPGGIFPTINDYYDKTPVNGVLAVELLPVGAIIRVEKLIHNPLETVTGDQPVGRILTGRFAGHTVSLLFLMDTDKGPPYEWHADSNFLSFVTSDQKKS
jgi:hypothetical protein